MDKTGSVEKLSADSIALVCVKLYRSLPKKGKPVSGKEWTVLAGIVEENLSTRLCRVVSLGTGTKCLGPSKMRMDGRILHDSHAEVIARRAFLRYIYHHLESVYRGENSDILVLNKETGKCTFFNHIRYHFYVSHTPCGDASIIPVKNKRLHLESEHENKGKCRKRKRNDSRIEYVKQPKVSEEVDDVLRTGGKPVTGEELDPKLPGHEYHTPGVLRNKPGRGEATISMSCSDKIAKWNIVGCLGALISHFIPEPLYFTSIIIGQCPYSEKAMRRAVYDRISTLTLVLPYRVNNPELLTSSVEFEDKFGPCRLPCASSIVWCKVPENAHEVSANGFRLGATKKQIGTKAAQCFISKNSLFQCFFNIKRLKCELLSAEEKGDKSTYRSFKDSATDYQSTWETLRKTVFTNWLLHDRKFDNFAE